MAREKSAKALRNGKPTKELSAQEMDAMFEKISDKLTKDLDKHTDKLNRLDIKSKQFDKHMEELRLNEEFHSLLEVVAHPFGELKRVEHAAIRSADTTSVWYLGQVDDGCHAAPVFFEDMWIGVHLQPSLSEPGRRCLRVDALFAETSSAVDTAADSRVARGRDHPDLTILAATTFVGLTSHHRPLQIIT